MRRIGIGVGIIMAFAAPFAYGQTGPSNFWSGPYAGVHLGYGGGRAEAREINGPRLYGADTSGGIAGFHLGWRKTVGDFVLGTEVEAGTLGQSGDTVRGDESGRVTLDAGLGAYASLSGLAGYQLTPDWLLFGRAGLTIAAVDTRVAQSCPSAACALSPSAASPRDHAWGYLFGAGVEHRFADRWSGRLEYQFTDFRRELALPTEGPGWSLDKDLHALKLSLNRRF